MKTATNRLNIEQLPDIFGPIELARVLGVQQNMGYTLVKQPDFPSIRVGNKHRIMKNSFLLWLKEREMQRATL